MVDQVDNQEKQVSDIKSKVETLLKDALTVLKNTSNTSVVTQNLVQAANLVQGTDISISSINGYKELVQEVARIDSDLAAKINKDYGKQINQEDKEKSEKDRENDARKHIHDLVDSLDKQEEEEKKKDAARIRALENYKKANTKEDKDKASKEFVNTLDSDDKIKQRLDKTNKALEQYDSIKNLSEEDKRAKKVLEAQKQVDKAGVDLRDKDRNGQSISEEDMKAFLTKRETLVQTWQREDKSKNQKEEETVRKEVINVTKAKKGGKVNPKTSIEALQEDSDDKKILAARTKGAIREAKNTLPPQKEAEVPKETKSTTQNAKIIEEVRGEESGLFKKPKTPIKQNKTNKDKGNGPDFH